MLIYTDTIFDPVIYCLLIIVLGSHEIHQVIHGSFGFKNEFSNWPSFIHFFAKMKVARPFGPYAKRVAEVKIVDFYEDLLFYNVLEFQFFDDASML